MTTIIALVGKSGAGKDSLLNALFHSTDNLCGVGIHKIIPITTRPKRENEVDGKDYYFYTSEQFLNELENNNLLEATVFKSNWCYGTLKSSIQKDKINIGIFNPEGLICLLNNIDVFEEEIKTIVINIDVNDRDRMVRQLLREEDPDITEICRRYAADKRDFLQLEYEDVFYHIYENNNGKPPSKFKEFLEQLLQDKKD